jgi:hypothetical protein
MKRILNISFVICLIMLALQNWSCKHSPIIPIDDDMMPIDTMPMDTTPGGIPCDPLVVYFNQDVLPILNSNCAFSGCHDAASAENDVILESYEDVIATADVEPFNLDESKIYKVLVENDIEDRMPPSPNSPLSPDQIQIIAQWILQGAENLTCDPSLSECDTIDVSFANAVQPLIVSHCQGCHSGSAPSGGIDLSEYNGVKNVADNGKLIGAISWEAGFEKMPQGGDKLSECDIAKVQSWIDDGALNN